MDIWVDVVISGFETYTPIPGAENAALLNPNVDGIGSAGIERD
jgi:hypothetical protein